MNQKRILPVHTMYQCPNDRWFLRYENAAIECYESLKKIHLRASLSKNKLKE